ncbi:MAG: alanine racemase [Pseudorhodoplanes sp.]|jgi:alanine racemase|nr:alanine racemase [Pseudorhodoplanes sp.]
MSAQEAAPEQTTFAYGPPAAEAGGILTVDLGAIEANWKKLRGMAIPTECAAVVKADAYGCGLEPVTALLYHAGCTTFFVADLAEGKRVRRIAPDAVVYILGGLPPGTAPVFAEHALRPVIGSSAELAEWDSFVSASNWHGGIALHVDTGMNRLGVTIEEATALAPRIKAENHGIMLLMSHFVASEIHEHPRNNEQMLAFREIRSLYRGVPASISNSSGIFLGSSAHLDLIRPGVSLYGVNPTPGKPNPMRSVVHLDARIILTREVAFGDTVGYDANWTARRPSRIAIVAIGYADGYFRMASGTDLKQGGVVLVAGRRCPIVGLISMDLMAVDITDLPGSAVRRGDYVTLIGEGFDVDALAEQFDTNGYEVLTSLGRRYARIYKSTGG